MKTRNKGDPSLSLKSSKLKEVVDKNKKSPQHLRKKKKLLNELVKEEKERLKIKDELLSSEDEEDIADSVPQEVLTNEKKIILKNKKASTCRKRTKDQKIVPFAILQRHKLREIFLKLDKEDKPTDKQKKLEACINVMHHQRSNLWNSPLIIIDAINDSLLNRNWSNITYLLLQLVQFKNDKYKPIIHKVYEVMDKLCPTIIENDLQGEYKKIQGAKKQILETTTVV